MYQELSDTGQPVLCSRMEIYVNGSIIIDHVFRPAAGVKYNSQVNTYSCRRLTQCDAVITLSRTSQRISHAIR
jgi:hypothetical protein